MISFADEEITIRETGDFVRDGMLQITWLGKELFVKSDLKGAYQLKNYPGIIKVIEQMQSLGYEISDMHMLHGISNVVRNTGLLGRWQKLGDEPMIICDTVHNEHGVAQIVKQLNGLQYKNLYIIWGMVAGKNLDSVLTQLPANARYYYCEPNIPRALSAAELAEAAARCGLHGEVVSDVNKALRMATARAGKEDLIFVGGSNFVIAEIEHLKQ